MCTTLLPARLVAQTPPFWSTVVREGSLGWPLGEVQYSPSTFPVSVSIFTTVPLLETATQMKWNPVVWSPSRSWLPSRTTLISVSPGVGVVADSVVPLPGRGCTVIVTSSLSASCESEAVSLSR